MIISFASCKPDLRETGGTKYFDLKGYFAKAAAQLKKRNPTVLKTAVHNNNTETKKLNIGNWEHELGLFAASDINKPAWKDSYSIKHTADSTVYTAIDADMGTRKIVITGSGSKITRIFISNHTKNLLYETGEKLTWVPDSLYQIEKWQDVRLLGRNSYEIKGLLAQ